MAENNQETEQVVDVNAIAVVEDGTQQVEKLDGANAAQEQQQTSETQTETQKENQTEPEKKTGVIEAIKNIIRRKADDGRGENADVDAGAKTGTGVGTAVPVEFVQAATKAGMSAQQIEDFTSDYTNEELLKQIPLLETQVSENSDKSEQLSQKETGVAQQQQQQQVVTEKAGDETEKDVEIKLLRERLDKVEASQQKSSERSQEDVLVSMASRATKRMDELSKEFAVFGTYDKLPRWPHNNQIIPNSPEAIARNEVWGLAYDLTTKAGIHFDKALEISVNAYKGKNLAKDVERNLVRDLKANEKRLSAKHTSHESVKTNMTGVDIIRSVGKKHGVEIR